ncbi:DNA/RNA non-specific endonuclease [Flavivirga spongiicola]|uniref:DNA/RNA non-specific endonuclease n=1 Tax=Flavivirga spongiicola TaxID=421621 RepID=A0ABU7XPE6_9FLAO|nr:DNA/RNA non-specific endonuclease [Flavivirga sp. MEBiC05379]MDO5977308.1 DNA/RNA non-specific endonuclease [Flavivirga sp. MEBiC05379]
MSPQKPNFNREKWQTLEKEIRKLNNRGKVLETSVLTAPAFHFNIKIETIGDNINEYGIDILIPHAFVKSVLTEDIRGRLSL